MRQPRPTERDGLARARYFNRQLVLPSDLDQDRIYLLEKLRRHNRLLHGWGILNDWLGLEAVPAPGNGSAGAPAKPVYKACEYPVVHVPPDVDPAKGTWLVVAPGYALTPLGDEIYLPCPVFVDTVREWADGTLVTSPADCRPVPGMKSLTRADQDVFCLVVEAWEEDGGAVRTALARCGDDSENFEFSRVADTVAFRLIPELDFSPPFDDPKTPAGRKQLLTGTPKRKYVSLGQLRFSGGRVQITPPPQPWDRAPDRDPVLGVPATGASAGPAPLADPGNVPLSQLGSARVAPPALRQHLERHSLLVKDAVRRNFNEFRDAVARMMNADATALESHLRNIWEEAKALYERALRSRAPGAGAPPPPG
jgi:hypothetical protein